MSTWMNYMLEANAGLVLFLLIYRLLLHNETQFAFKRVYLLAGMVFSLTFPLITMPATSVHIPSIEYTLPSEWQELSQVEIPISNKDAVKPLPLWSWILYGYLSIVVILAIRFLYRLITIFLRLSRRTGDANIVIINDPHVYAFSFFKFIFISNAHHLSPEDQERIIRHETVHIKKWHSVDRLLIELVRIIFWFNPILIYYNQELSTVHEFEADEASVKPDEIDKYCTLLAKSAITSAGFSFANHFNNSLTLKRIAMMKTIKRRMRQWKPLIILMITTLFFVAVSCQDQIVSGSKTEEAVISVADEPASPLGGMTNLYDKLAAELKMPEEAWNKGVGGKVFVEVIVEKDGTTSNAKIIKGIGLGCDEEALRAFTAINMLWEPARQNGVPVRMKFVFPITFMPNPAVSNQTEQPEVNTQRRSLVEGDVYTIVERSARPVGGMEALYAEINSLLKMPADAKKRGISGKVFVEFIVEPDGTTSHHKVLKGVGGGCDEEALRILKIVNTK